MNIMFHIIGQERYFKHRADDDLTRFIPLHEVRIFGLQLWDPSNLDPALKLSRIGCCSKSNKRFIIILNDEAQLGEQSCEGTNRTVGLQGKDSHYFVIV